MRLKQSRLKSRQKAFTLIEVLVAIVVFSIGLIGIGAAMALSIRSTNVASQRTHAVFLAESLGDMMRANDQGVWALAYDGDYPVTGTPANCDSGCNFSQIALRDQQVWSNLLTRTLANGRARVDCAMVAGSRPALGIRRPADGLCTVRLTWTEGVDSTDTSGTRDQSFAWVINP